MRIKILMLVFCAAVNAMANIPTLKAVNLESPIQSSSELTTTNLAAEGLNLDLLGFEETERTQIVSVEIVHFNNSAEALPSTTKKPSDRPVIFKFLAGLSVVITFAGFWTFRSYRNIEAVSDK